MQTQLPLTSSTSQNLPSIRIIKISPIQTASLKRRFASAYSANINLHRILHFAQKKNEAILGDKNNDFRYENVIILALYPRNSSAPGALGNIINSNREYAFAQVQYITYALRLFYAVLLSFTFYTTFWPKYLLVNNLSLSRAQRSIIHKELLQAPSIPLNPLCSRQSIYVGRPMLNSPLFVVVRV